MYSIVMRWDLELLEQIAAHRRHGIDTLTVILMTAGMSPLAYVAALVACLVFAWRWRVWTVGIAALVSAVLSVALADVGKMLIGRARPPAELALVQTGGFAMPSSIAAMTLGAAMPVILYGVRTGTRAGRFLAALLVTAVLAIGLSMLYLGAHWASDLVAGWLLGGVVGAGTLAGLTAVARVVPRVLQ